MKIKYLILFIAFPIILFGQPYGHYGHSGIGLKVTSDTTTISKLAGSIYFNSVDSTVWIANGGGLQRIIAFNGNDKFPGTFYVYPGRISVRSTDNTYYPMYIRNDDGGKLLYLNYGGAMLFNIVAGDGIVMGCDSNHKLSLYSGGQGSSPQFIMGTDGKIILSYRKHEIDSTGMHVETSMIADDGEITLTTGRAGRGSAQIGDNEEYARFRFSSDGTVVVLEQSTNVAGTDTDGNLCIYDAGSGIAIKNRLGSQKRISCEVFYYVP